MSVRLMGLAGGETVVPQGTFDAFRARLRGTLLLPGQPPYESARRVWNGMIDRRPGLIVQCRSREDVAAAVRLAADHGVRVAVRGGGHNVAGTAVCEGGMVIDLSGMRRVEVDPSGGLVRIEGGATLGDVDRATACHGLATAMGVVTATGYAGLTLHGGAGWLLRRHGLAADQLTAAELVTADGRVQRVDADHCPDLLWALKGGGGNFGVVTTFTSRLHPMPPQVLFIVPVFGLDDAGRVLSGVRDYMQEAPAELMVIAALWTIPDDAAVPQARRGQPGLFLLTCFPGPAEAAERAVAPLRQFAQPLFQMGGAMAWTEAQAFLDADYPDGRRYYWKSTLIRHLDDAVIETVVAHAAARPSPLTSIDLWMLGGAFANVPADATAFGRRDVRCLVAYESNWEEADRDEPNIRWTRESLAKVQAQSQARTYLNFAGYGEEGPALVQQSLGENYPRLQQLKQEVDPLNLFRGHLNIPPDPFTARLSAA